MLLLLSLQKHNQLIYTGVKLPYDIASFLMPVWAILYVFRYTVVYLKKRLKEY